MIAHPTGTESGGRRPLGLIAALLFTALLTAIIAIGVTTAAAQSDPTAQARPQVVAGLHPGEVIVTC